MSSKRRKREAPLPAAGAGLLRFFEDETEGIKVRPEMAIVAALALIIASVLLVLLI